MAARGYLGAGDLYIARYNAGTGAFLDYEGPFECTKFAIKPNVQLKEQISKGKSTYGQVIETAAVPQPAELTVDLAEVNDLSLAIALFGTTQAVAQTAGPVSESIVLVADKWVPLSKGRLDGAVSIAGSVEGVDYLVNRTLGWVKALSTGNLSAGGSTAVTATALAIAGTQINGQTQTQVRARFKLDGKNFADDLPTIVTVHEALIAADSEFDFLADDFNTVSLPGRMKTPVGFTEPFTVVQRTAA